MTSNRPMGSIIFVHGTGVRLQRYQEEFNVAVATANSAGVSEKLTPCAWGDALGVSTPSKSIPDVPSPNEQDIEELDKWKWLFYSPLIELERLIWLPQTSTPSPSVRPEWENLWNSIVSYKQSNELLLLLRRESMENFWDEAWHATVGTSPVPKQAFEACADHLADAVQALARALVANLHLVSTAQSSRGPSSELRAKITARLVKDWGYEVYGIGSVLWDFTTSMVTPLVRSNRHALTKSISNHIGDILSYQSKGQEVRDFLRTVIGKAEGPVTVVAHSLGGIAAVDLLAGPSAPEVRLLVTVGSQASFFYELGALSSLKPSDDLPQQFPAWLNIFDRNDFLSYVCNPIWPGRVRDVEVASGLPFPSAHTAYFSNVAVWMQIKQEMSNIGKS